MIIWCLIINLVLIAESNYLHSINSTVDSGTFSFEHYHYLNNLLVQNQGYHYKHTLLIIQKWTDKKIHFLDRKLELLNDLRLVRYCGQIVKMLKRFE